MVAPGAGGDGRAGLTGCDENGRVWRAHGAEPRPADDLERDRATVARAVEDRGDVPATLDAKALVRMRIDALPAGSEWIGDHAPAVRQLPLSGAANGEPLLRVGAAHLEGLGLQAESLGAASREGQPDEGGSDSERGAPKPHHPLHRARRTRH